MAGSSKLKSPKSSKVSLHGSPVLARKSTKDTLKSPIEQDFTSSESNRSGQGVPSKAGPSELKSPKSSKVSLHGVDTLKIDLPVIPQSAKIQVRSSGMNQTEALRETIESEKGNGFAKFVSHLKYVVVIKCIKNPLL